MHVNDCRCILTGLQALHVAGYGHGDLRWPNVIELPPLNTGDHMIKQPPRSSGDYVLIDLESAVKLGESYSGPHDRRSWREGEVLDAGIYTVKSDLRQLAHMVESEAPTHGFAKDILQGRINTVEEAISAVNALLPALTPIVGQKRGHQSED